MGEHLPEPDESGREPDPGSVGGDAACGLPRVCNTCGAVTEGELPARCWRCGDVVGQLPLA